jgi:hypothetical protein
MFRVFTVYTETFSAVYGRQQNAGAQTKNANDQLLFAMDFMAYSIGYMPSLRTKREQRKEKPTLLSPLGMRLYLQLGS